MLMIHSQDILNINNKLFEIIYDIRQEFPFFSQELTAIKDKLFTNNKINPIVCGQGIEILRVLQNAGNQEKADIWRLVLFLTLILNFNSERFSGFYSVYYY